MGLWGAESLYWARGLWVPPGAYRALLSGPLERVVLSCSMGACEGSPVDGKDPFPPP